MKFLGGSRSLRFTRDDGNYEYECLLFVQDHFTVFELTDTLNMGAFKR
ncbi:MAG: hypothetical protein ABJF11_13860 [Reichenbachiella sp.]